MQSEYVVWAVQLWNRWVGLAGHMRGVERELQAMWGCTSWGGAVKLPCKQGLGHITRTHKLAVHTILTLMRADSMAPLIASRTLKSVWAARRHPQTQPPTATARRGTHLRSRSTR